jgi:hypothetical protein
MSKLSHRRSTYRLGLLTKRQARRFKPKHVVFQFGVKYQKTRQKALPFSDSEVETYVYTRFMDNSLFAAIFRGSSWE